MVFVGTPILTSKPEDTPGMLIMEDTTRKGIKNGPGEQSMRKTIADLVASVDPNVRLDDDVEDVSVPQI